MIDVIVIGGGPAGMMAAGTAGEKGLSVTLLERNNKLGKKLYITGKGRCNVTNAADIEEHLKNTPGNPYFMYSSLYAMDSLGLIDFFENLGVKLKVERGERVFPVSEKASDIVRALARYLEKNNVDVRLNTGVSEIVCDENKVIGVATDDGEIIKAHSVVVATGGLSYPMTGSTGDGYKFAKNVGHKITKLYPSIVPLKTSESWVLELQGLSLKNIAIDLKINNKSEYKDFGEMIFTHFGISGPVALSASRYAIGKFHLRPTLSIDLKPALDEKELDKRILRDFQKYINKDFRNSLDDLLPQKLIPVIIDLSGIDPYTKVHEIKKEDRKKLVDAIKNLTVTLTDTTGYNEAVITSGGVSVNEIDSSTMESKLVSGLYFAGEVLDVDAYTGGFNLQIAFSTGFLAGEKVMGCSDDSN